ncbi:MAG TPA: hypothetical protein VGL53_03060 [Bryobacteraceae bacterium]|jgi:chromosome partitioning protein
MIIDAPPHSTAGTLKIAQAADVVILPTGLSLDDMQPSVLLADELVKKGVAKSKIAFALCRVGDSHLEVNESQNYVTEAGYRVLKGSIPEKIAYRRASDEGRALTETRFPSLNEKGRQARAERRGFRGEAPNWKGRLMAKVPAPTRKGSPPAAETTVGNLDKPEREPTSNLQSF